MIVDEELIDRIDEQTDRYFRCHARSKEDTTIMRNSRCKPIDNLAVFFSPPASFRP